MTKFKKMEFKVTSLDQTYKLLEILVTFGYRTYSGIPSLVHAPTSYPWHFHTWEGDGYITHSKSTMGDDFETIDTEEFINEHSKKDDYSNLQFNVTSLEQLTQLLKVLNNLGHSFRHQEDVEYYHEKYMRNNNVYIQTWNDKYLTISQQFFNGHKWEIIDTEQFIKQNTKHSTTFNYDAAKNGVKISTKNGLEVNILVWDAISDYCIIGTVIKDGEEYVQSWNPDGECRTQDIKYNLVIVPDRVFPKTTLTFSEMNEIWCTTVGQTDTMFAIANAAVKQYILDSEK